MPLPLPLDYGPPIISLFPVCYASWELTFEETLVCIKTPYMDVPGMPNSDTHRKKNRVPDLGFYPINLGICSIKCFTVVLGTLNTFDGTDPKVDRLKPKVRNTIFFPATTWTYQVCPTVTHTGSSPRRNHFQSVIIIMCRTHIWERRNIYAHKLYNRCREVAVSSREERRPCFWCFSFCYRL